MAGKRKTVDELRKHPVLQQINTLSSGTMATLTDERDMKVLDLIQQNFYLYTLAGLLSGLEFDSWRQAWHHYENEGERQIRG